MPAPRTGRTRVAAFVWDTLLALYLAECLAAWPLLVLGLSLLERSTLRAAHRATLETWNRIRLTYRYDALWG